MNRERKGNGGDRWISSYRFQMFIWILSQDTIPFSLQSRYLLGYVMKGSSLWTHRSIKQVRNPNSWNSTLFTDYSQVGHRRGISPIVQTWNHEVNRKDSVEHLTTRGVSLPTWGTGKQKKSIFGLYKTCCGMRRAGTKAVEKEEARLFEEEWARENRGENKGTKRVSCLKRICWSVRLFGCALCLITAVCPVIVLSSNSNHFFSGWGDSILCAREAYTVQAIGLRTVSHRSLRSWGVISWREQRSASGRRHTGREVTRTFKGPGPATGQMEGMLSCSSETTESGKSKLPNFGIQSVLKSDSADLEKGKDGSNSDKIVSSLSKSASKWWAKRGSQA